MTNIHHARARLLPSLTLVRQEPLPPGINNVAARLRVITNRPALLLDACFAILAVVALILLEKMECRRLLVVFFAMYAKPGIYF